MPFRAVGSPDEKVHFGRKTRSSPNINEFWTNNVWMEALQEGARARLEDPEAPGQKEGLNKKQKAGTMLHDITSYMS